MGKGFPDEGCRFYKETIESGYSNLFAKETALIPFVGSTPTVSAASQKKLYEAMISDFHGTRTVFHYLEAWPRGLRR